MDKKNYVSKLNTNVKSQLKLNSEILCVHAKNPSQRVIYISAGKFYKYIQIHIFLCKKSIVQNDILQEMQETGEHTDLILVARNATFNVHSTLLGNY